MNELLCYVVCWLLDGHEYFLLWLDGGSEPDQFVVLEPGSTQLLIAETREELTAYAQKRRLLVSDQPPQVIDFSALKTALNGLRSDRPISMGVAELFLNAWNTLDDVSHTIGTPIMLVESDCKQGMDRLYEKLFYGNNLPSITPKGQKYCPILDANERHLLKSLFRRAMQRLVSLVKLYEKGA